MLQGAKQAQWESVQELQKLRDGLLQAFFAEGYTLNNAELATGINYMLESDKELADLGMQERNQLQSQIGRIKQGKTAVKAYTLK